MNTQAYRNSALAAVDIYWQPGSLQDRRSARRPQNNESLGEKAAAFRARYNEYLEKLQQRDKKLVHGGGSSVNEDLQENSISQRYPESEDSIESHIDGEDIAECIEEEPCQVDDVVEDAAVQELFQEISEEAGIPHCFQPFQAKLPVMSSVSAKCRPSPVGFMVQVSESDREVDREVILEDVSNDLENDNSATEAEPIEDADAASETSPSDLVNENTCSLRDFSSDGVDLTSESGITDRSQQEDESNMQTSVPQRKRRVHRSKLSLSIVRRKKSIREATNGEEDLCLDVVETSSHGQSDVDNGLAQGSLDLNSVFIKSSSMRRGLHGLNRRGSVAADLRLGLRAVTPLSPDYVLQGHAAVEALTERGTASTGFGHIDRLVIDGSQTERMRVPRRSAWAQQLGTPGFWKNRSPRLMMHVL